MASFPEGTGGRTAAAPVSRTELSRARGRVAGGWHHGAAEVKPPLGAWSLQTSTWVSLRNGASEAARTAWPTDFNGVTAAVLKPSLLGQPVSCVLHWDRTKTGGMGQRRPGTVRDIVLNVKTLS